VLDVGFALAAGVALGAATGVPLGVLNAALIEAATRVGRRHATGIGLGGALADGVHAGLAFAGLAPLLARVDLARRALLVASAAIVVGYAVVVWRRRATATVPRSPVFSTGEGGTLRGVWIGLALTLPNPAPLLAWVAVAGVVLPDASVAAALAGALGVVVGSAAWFALLARIAASGALDGRAARWVPRVVAVVLVGFAAAAVAQAF
jgi:threonine/homoserine/homoserine lactone efflux protein